MIWSLMRMPVPAIISLIGLVLALVLTPSNAVARPTSPASHDRWLEIDLYWFDAEQPERSAERFWRRYKPLFKDAAGHRGVILNVGMTVNYVMEYRGEPSQRIVLPRGAGQELGTPIAGQLEGTSAQRQTAWRTRYQAADNAKSRAGYGAWTYGGLRRLTSALKSQAAARGIAEFRVGSLIVGSDGAYGEKAPFALAHSEAWTRWRVDAAGALDSSSNFDPSARLDADPTPRGGLPQGISQGLPVYAAFAAQWGALSRDAGLDALMLRDAMSFPRGFTRYGPFGDHVPDAATAERITAGVATFIRASKQANPKSLIMMYSTAASPTSDWRANGIDLERIANEGFLDIFVDQTWAGAWNEVGVRQQSFWNSPILGWTYQQANMLQHAAVLANSKVRHYFLTETFDAWESWDTIHTAPDRLRWGIWAYSHAAVKTPQGLRVPAGTYISWGNRGDSLLSADDVTFLSDTLSAAFADAKAMREVYGPTIVYTREVHAAQVRDIAEFGDPRDRIDEQIGSLIKWPLPISSITRLEWISKISSPLFVFGATKGLGKADIARLERLAASGQPMAFFGAFGAGTDDAVLRFAGARSTENRPSIADRRLDASLGTAAERLRLVNFGREFSAPPPLRSNSAGPEDVVYAFGKSVGLVRQARAGRDIVMWDPTPLADYWFRPLIDNMNGDSAPYGLAAAALTAQLATRDQIRADTTDLRQTGTFAAWRGEDGRVRVLAGNLEEGLRDDADRARMIRLRLPKSWGRGIWTDAWGGAALGADPALTIRIPPQGSVLLTSQGTIN